jgi:hypothetical protein
MTKFVYVVRISAMTTLAAAVIACSSSSSSSSNPAGTGDPGVDAGTSQNNHDSGAPTDAGHSVDTGAPPGDSGNGGVDAADAAPATSPYAVSCSAASQTCPGTPLVCQKFSFGGGAVSTYACTKTCTATTDCGTSPAGFPPVECLQFTTSKYCVLACDATSATSCPSPLKCVANGGQAVGICVTL